MIVTGILVAPSASKPSMADAWGSIVFTYNEKPKFSAPVVSLQDRYHGLTTLAGLTQRFRLAVDPEFMPDDLIGVLMPPFDAFAMRAQIMFDVRHEVEGAYVDPKTGSQDFVVEIQGYVGYADRPEDFGPNPLFGRKR